MNVLLDAPPPLAIPWQPVGGPLCYLATPYSKYPLEQAFEDAAALAAVLVRAGVKVYSPIAHTHPIAVHGGLRFPLDHAFWMSFDETMMVKADILVVAQMTGWEESKGIAIEIAAFERAKKPVFLFDPELRAFARFRELCPRAVLP